MKSKSDAGLASLLRGPARPPAGLGAGAGAALDKVIVFSQWTSMLDLLQEPLKARKYETHSPPPPPPPSTLLPHALWKINLDICMSHHSILAPLQAQRPMLMTFVTIVVTTMQFSF